MRSKFSDRDRFEQLCDSLGISVSMGAQIENLTQSSLEDKDSRAYALWRDGYGNSESGDKVAFLDLNTLTFWEGGEKIFEEDKNE